MLLRAVLLAVSLGSVSMASSSTPAAEEPQQCEIDELSACPIYCDDDPHPYWSFGSCYSHCSGTCTRICD